MNKMKKISIEKVTLNIGVGEPGRGVDRAKELLDKISGENSIKTKSKKRVPAWGLRPGVEIGAKVTLRGEKAVEVLKRLLEAKSNTINKSSFDKFGNLSFGISEYIDIPEVEYDPEIGIIGLDVSVTMHRPGYNVENVGKSHRITPEESTEFFKDKFGVDAE